MTLLGVYHNPFPLAYFNFYDTTRMCMMTTSLPYLMIYFYVTKTILYMVNMQLCCVSKLQKLKILRKANTSTKSQNVTLDKNKVYKGQKFKQYVEEKMQYMFGKRKDAIKYVFKISSRNNFLNRYQRFYSCFLYVLIQMVWCSSGLA